MSWVSFLALIFALAVANSTSPGIWIWWPTIFALPTATTLGGGGGGGGAGVVAGGGGGVAATVGGGCGGASGAPACRLASASPLHPFNASPRASAAMLNRGKMAFLNFMDASFIRNDPSRRRFDVRGHKLSLLAPSTP